jgi:hypothetical protein
MFSLFQPQEKCSKTTNNFFYNCPPKMADGRMFTSYHPRRDYHYCLKKDIGIKDQTELRSKLQGNPDVYVERIEQIHKKNHCMNPGLELPPPARVYRVEKTGVVFYDTNLPGGIGIMEESQWKQVKKMNVAEKNEVAKCRPNSYEHLASSEAIRQLNRQHSLYAGQPFGLYHQNY